VYYIVTGESVEIARRNKIAHRAARLQHAIKSIIRRPCNSSDCVKTLSAVLSNSTFNPDYLGCGSFFFFRLLFMRSDLKREYKVSFVSRDRRVKWHIFCLRIIIMLIQRETKGFWLGTSFDLRVCDDCMRYKRVTLDKIRRTFFIFLPLTNNFIYFIFKPSRACKYAGEYERMEETKRLIHIVFVALIQV